MQDENMALKILRQHDIPATYQRLKVMENLLARRDHPCAEEIWEALKGCQPPIAKATVYNVLRLLCDKGILRPLYIDPDTLRYDIRLDGHGHFHCEACGRIYNFPARTDDSPSEGLEGFRVTQRDLYYRGVCPRCQADKQAAKTE